MNGENSMIDLHKEYKDFIEWCHKNRHLDLDPRLHWCGGKLGEGGYISHDETRTAFAAWRERAKQSTAILKEVEDYVLANSKIKDLLLEQGLDFNINTIEDLVKVYVSCRQTNQNLVKQLQTLQEDCQKGLQSSIAKQMIENNYVSIEKLKSMTIQEIVWLIGE